MVAKSNMHVKSNINMQTCSPQTSIFIFLKHLICKIIKHMNTCKYEKEIMLLQVPHSGQSIYFPFLNPFPMAPTQLKQAQYK